MPTELKQLPPLANLIVDRTIDNANRKLVAGFRNKNNSRPNAKNPDPSAVATDTVEAASAKSGIDVANRGVAWREMIEKSLTHGISSLATMRFDGEFTIKNGIADGLGAVPNQPGVYVVFNKDQEAVYIGDSTELKRRWHAGHLNEAKQGEKTGKPYKLAAEMTEGCTVRYVIMDSEQTAAALEAHLIKIENPRVNKREELVSEQGKRTNIEGKKIKDASGSTASLAAGAACEAALNSGWAVMEQLTAAVLKALKDELVDIFGGGRAKLIERIKRFFAKVWAVIARIIDAPMQLLAGIFEFIVNALSKAIRQLYQLAKNMFDLGNQAWTLFQGARGMTRDELIQKVTETIVVSATMVFWDAVDPVIEAQLFGIIGPVAPYAAAAISAIGFGLSSHYLQRFVPKVVDYLLATRTGFHDALDAQRDACQRMIALQETECDMINGLNEYMVSSARFEVETKAQIRSLSSHQAIEVFDVRTMLRNKR